MLSLVFVGSHTGSIEALGGGGHPGYGGAGSGGYITISHSHAHKGMPPYRGSYKTFGGPGSGGAEPGAAGIIWLKDEDLDHKEMIVDNNEQKQISETTSLENEGRRLDLSPTSYSTDLSYMSREGHTVATSKPIYSCSYLHYNCLPDYNQAGSYVLGNCFDQTLDSSSKHVFTVLGSTTELTITLKEALFINKIKVYPWINYPTKVMVCTIDIYITFI